MTFSPSRVVPGQLSGLTAPAPFTVAELWNETPFQLRRVWGGINGMLCNQKLHCVDIQAPYSRYQPD
jgi:hypothetical protein